MLIPIPQRTSMAMAGAELLTGPGPGGPPQTQVLDASTKSLLDSFFAFDEGFLGGVFVAGG